MPAAMYVELSPDCALHAFPTDVVTVLDSITSIFLCKDRIIPVWSSFFSSLFFYYNNIIIILNPVN